MPDTKFGLDQVGNETPKWSKWMFRITIILTTVAAFVIAADPGIPDIIKVRIGVYLKGLDMLVLGFSKMFGVEVQDTTENKN
ncbi:hypothetical protein SAMN05428988_0169 [Chitinophaga sp. YR573]|uniref:hypothetical protein n=1 Tax=Chitinophaga sp. YR573 TaxID=1881040 RepID=UPI0008D48DF3|nr:hypothetical protein [Chitinophaga sp. YR573]SEV89032.1 hypothetical protein SAMN05428988_0169 [Chitinophaga sp. YR573]